MDLENPEYVLFFRCANNCQLNYLIIGGYAVNYYGYNRNTHDLDIWIEPTNENKLKFINTLQCMGYSKEETNPLLKEDFTKPFVGTIGAGDSALDFLTIIHHTVIFEEAQKKRLQTLVQNEINIYFVAYDFLINMKAISRRPKDILDITELNRIKNYNS